MKIYGIDLGTTYSAISHRADDGHIQVISNLDGDKITASAVFFERDSDEVLVGKNAKNSASTDPEHFVSLIKREMGTGWTKEFNGTNYTPESISAIIIKYLLKSAESEGHNVTDVVITCPAYFNNLQRQATRAAGEACGVKVHAVLDEPIAAALSYGFGAMAKQQCEGADAEPKNIIVYDLGGGTFDVSVLSMSPDEFKVICSDGDYRLGGADWDEKLSAIMMAKLTENRPEATDYEQDPRFKAELMVTVEETKRTLSARETAKATILCPDGSRERVEVTREEFETATREELERTLEFIDKMIKFAQEEKGVSKFDEFLLVGGSTYMPQVKAAIVERFTNQLGLEPKQHEPNQAVSMGATIYGEVRAIPEPGLPTQPGPITIRTVASKSIGVKAIDSTTRKEVCFNLIIKQDEVPATKSQRFRTDGDNARALKFEVLSNDCLSETEDLLLCDPIGEAEMKLTKSLPNHSPIEVTFSLSDDGGLLLKAHDLTNNDELEVEFKTSLIDAKKIGDTIGGIKF